MVSESHDTMPLYRISNCFYKRTVTEFIIQYPYFWFKRTVSFVRENRIFCLREPYLLFRRTVSLFCLFLMAFQANPN
jgi:hypothetical protein